MSDVQWRRLSPRMLLVHPVIEAGKAVPAIAGALLAGGGSLSGTLWAAGIAAAVMAFAVLRWFTTRYMIGTDAIALRHGLIRRRSTSARLERVRTVDVTSHPLHRALGIARVVIGTGTSDRKHDDRLVLDGLAVADAARLRAELLHAADARTAASPDETLASLDPRWIRFGPFTLTGAVTGLAVLGVVWRVVTEGHVRLDRLAAGRWLEHRFATWSPATGVLVVVLAVLAFVMLASTVGYLLSFWRFTLARNPAGSLHVSRGLLTTRRTSIEARRLVGAELSEPLLLRSVRGARVLAVATGLRVGRGAERGGEILLPPAPVGIATALAAGVLGSTTAFTVALPAHPRNALRRRMIRTVGAAGILTAAVAVIVALAGLTWWPVAVAAASIAPALALGHDRYRSLGHALVGPLLVTRAGTIVRRRSALHVDAVVGWTLRRSWFQRRTGLATVVATTAAGRQGYRIEDLADHEAAAFADSVTPGLLAQFAAQPAPQPLPAAL